MRFKKDMPELYDATDRISLCSSFITTMLCLDGEVKGIDESDACGMNLWRMNHKARGWHRKALEAIAGKEGADELERKLGVVETDGGRVVGKVGKWFVEKFGFNPDCCVFPGTGDNPATFLSLVCERIPAVSKTVSSSQCDHLRVLSVSAHPMLCSFRRARTTHTRNTMLSSIQLRLFPPRQKKIMRAEREVCATSTC